MQHAVASGNSQHEVCMENADQSARNWRRYPQLFSDVQKTGPNGWSAARRAASAQKLSSSSCRTCQQSPLPWRSYKISCSALRRAESCCPASNAYRTWPRRSTINGQKRQRQGNTHRRQHRGYPPLTIKKGWCDLQKRDLKLHQPWSKEPLSPCN